MAIDPLIQRFARLPGLGPRSARRLVLHLLQHREQKLEPLADALKDAATAVRVCGECGNLDATDPCPLCTDHARDAHTLCVVEEVSDLWAIERSHAFRGRYHVLGGTLSAIDGRGPDALGLGRLMERIRDRQITELILATNATVDGQTTAHYITGLVAPLGVRITRLAQGIPIGGELDYLDDGTLGTALRARQPV